MRGKKVVSSEKGYFSVGAEGGPAPITAGKNPLCRREGRSLRAERETKKEEKGHFLNPDGKKGGGRRLDEGGGGCSASEECSGTED